MRFRKVLQHTPKTQAYLDRLPKIYIVGFWAHYGVRGYPFTGKYVDYVVGTDATTGKGGTISVPLVYHYYDDNGTCSVWELIPLPDVTTGEIKVWTQSESTAKQIAKALEISSKLEKEKASLKKKKS